MIGSETGAHKYILPTIAKISVKKFLMGSMHKPAVEYANYADENTNVLNMH